MSNMQEITIELIQKALKTSKKLEKLDNLTEALACLDQIPSLQDKSHLETNEKVAIQISKLCNKLFHQVSNKLTYLRRAENSLMYWIALTDNHSPNFSEKIIRMILITYNNWATFHQIGQNYHMALSYLMKGLQIIDENNLTEPDSLQSIAKTKLNVSALYSELHRYTDAVSYAEDCLKTLQKEFKLRLSNSDFQQQSKKERLKTEVMIDSYVKAFYNIGVNQENMNNKEAMMQAFKNAVSIGSQFLKSANEVLTKAKKALSKGKSIKNKSLRLSSLTSPIQAVQNFMNSKRHVKARQSMQFEGLDQRFSKFVENKEKVVSEKKVQGRYYSEARLKELEEKLDNKDEMNFISVDKYFYTEISKLMNVSSDIKFLKPLTTSGAMSLWERQEEEKMKISDLRLKKHHRSNTSNESGGFLKIDEKIEKLKETDEEVLKKQEIKMKSKMKTKVYKQLLRTLNSRNNNYSSPPQRLFFKPPLSHRRSITHLPDTKKETTSKTSIFAEKRQHNIQTTKDEIENLMARITGEIKKIDVKKGVIKSPSQDASMTPSEIKTNKLASSTLKRFSHKKEKLSFLKGAITESLKKEVKKQTSPKILVRPNTLMAYKHD